MITLVSSGERLQAYDEGKQYGELLRGEVGSIQQLNLRIKYARLRWERECDENKRRYLFGVLSGLRGE